MFLAMIVPAKELIDQNYKISNKINILKN